MNNKNITRFMAVLGTAVLLSACGGQLKENPYLGKVPALRVAQDQEYTELRESYKKKFENAKSNKDYSKLDDKYDAARDAISEKYDRLYAEEAQKLMGKEIPYKCKDGLSYQIVSPVCVSKVEGGCVHITYEVELVKPLAWNDKIYMMPMDGSYSLGGQMPVALTGYNSTLKKVGDRMQVSQQIAMNTYPERWPNFSGLEFTDQATYSALISGGMIVTPGEE